MPNYRTELLTPWTTQDVGGEIAYIPQAAVDIRLQKWSDVTAQQIVGKLPEPNLLVIDATLDAAELQQVREQSKFHCIWCAPVEGTAPDAEPPDQRISLTDRTRLLTYLTQAGLTADLIDQALGTALNKTRRQTAQSLRTWLKTRA